MQEGVQEGGGGGGTDENRNSISSFIPPTHRRFVCIDCCMWGGQELFSMNFDCRYFWMQSRLQELMEREGKLVRKLQRGGGKEKYVNKKTCSSSNGKEAKTNYNR